VHYRPRRASCLPARVPVGIVVTVVRPTCALPVLLLSELQTMNCQIEHGASDSDVDAVWQSCSCYGGWQPRRGNENLRFFFPAQRRARVADRRLLPWGTDVAS
jgi:hypothetical protein